jgi:uncharacterized protein
MTDTRTPPSLPRALTATEMRVLGTLIEKSLTTPEQYPLSLNAVKVGCNQKTSREPVVNYDERTAGMALRDLIDLKLVKEVFPPDRGAVKYEHRLGVTLDLRAPAVAVLATLLLRGAQTTGELRQNGQRLHAFETLGHLEDVLDRISERGLTLKLERAPGQREERYVQLMGERDLALKQAAASVATLFEGTAARSGRSDAREEHVAAHAEALAALRAELAELRARVETLEALI